MPQSMQRATCCWIFSTGKSWNSTNQSLTCSATARLVGSSRAYSMKPVTLPMCGDSLAGDAEHALELVREYFHELREQALPVFQDPIGAWAAGFFGVARDPVPQVFDILGVFDRLQIHARGIAAGLAEVAGFIQHECDPARH